jgi:hypothetical protein
METIPWLNHLSYIKEDAKMPLSTEKLIKETCDEICKMLLQKNRSYGNSALKPIRIFSTSSEEEQLLVRIDDKLSRIKRKGIYPHGEESPVKDLIGYLILLLIWMKNQEKIVDAPSSWMANIIASWAKLGQIINGVFKDA